MTEDELQKILETVLPAADLHDVFVEECQDQDIRLRFSLKPGESWSSDNRLALDQLSPGLREKRRRMSWSWHSSTKTSCRSAAGRTVSNIFCSSSSVMGAMVCYP